MNSNKPPKIIAHRGVPQVLPGNTYESIHAATQLPIYGVEFDVDLTKDNVPILFHGSTFPPNESFDALELGSRQLDRRWTHDYNFDQIKHFDIGSWMHSRHGNLRFTTLDAMLEIDWGKVEACVELKNPYFYTDIDSTPFGQRILDVATPSLEKFLEKNGKLQLIFFDPKTLKLARARFPQVDCNLAIECFDPVDPDQTVQEALNCNASGLILLNKWIIEDPRWIEFSSRNGLKVWAYELTPDKDQIQAGADSRQILESGWQSIFDFGIEGLHCDYPVECYQFFQKLLKAMEGRSKLASGA